MKKIFRLVLSSIFIVWMILECYRILSWKDTAGGYLSSTQQLYYTEKNLIDVAFVGSSHSYAGIYPEFLWEEYGISSFNMATSGQDKDTTCHVIKELCKTQKPKVVFVDLFGLTFDRHGVQGNVYRNMLALKTSRNSVELVQEYVEGENQWDYILRWPIVHTRYRELGKYDFVDYEFSNFGRGGLFDWTVRPQAAAFYYQTEECEELSEKNKEWLDELQNLSVLYNFELVPIMLPCYLEEQNQMIINGARKYLEEQKISFLDFNVLSTQIGLDYTRDFFDSGHLNAYGAKKVSLYLGEHINQRYDLIDHREDENYDLWNQSTQFYHQREQEIQLLSIQDMFQWISQIKKMQNLTLIVSLDGRYEASEIDLYVFLEELGIDVWEAEKGGKWIVSEGEVREFFGNECRDTFLEDIGDETLKIKNFYNEEDEQIGSSILLDREEYAILKDGLNIIVYDEVQKKVIQYKGFFE